MPTPKGGTKSRKARPILRAVGPDERAAPLELPPPLEPPPTLPERAIPIWRWVCALDHVRSCCGPADLLLLEQLVVKIMWWRRAVDVREAAGGELTYESQTEGGGLIERPFAELNIALQYGKQISAELGRLGLSPTDRDRVVGQLKPGRKADPLAEFRVR